MPPLTLMIKPVSSMCNMRCKYCFYADVTRHRETQSFGVMSRETLDKLVRRAFAYAEGSVSFAFQGGEPTLAGADFFRELLNLERKYNSRHIDVNNSIQTNAFDLSDDLIDVLVKGRFLVGVSLDGPAAIHDRMRIDARGAGTYATVTRNIERLRSAGVEYNILCVVNRYIAQSPREVWEALAPHTYLQFIPCLDGFDGQNEDYSLTAEDYLGFLKTTFDLYYQAFKQRRYVSVRTFDNYIGILLGQLPENCAMQGRCGIYYLIEGDGGVYPCDFYVLDKWRMGNVNSASFHTLAKSDVAAEFRGQSHYTAPECLNCKWAKLCRGGCKRDREPFVPVADARTGETVLRPGLNRFCGAFKEFFEYSYPRMEEMARDIAQKENVMRTGYDIFGRAYGVMLRNDPHASASVDHALLRKMTLLDAESHDRLYCGEPPCVSSGISRHELYGFAQQFCGADDAQSIHNVLDYVSGIALAYDADIADMLFGGTECEILERGTDWCADLARVGLVMLNCLGVPARIVYLANRGKAYNGHVAVEAYYDGAWGVCDFVYGYMFFDGHPLSAWELMRDHAKLRPYMDEERFDDYAGLYDGVAIADYAPMDAANDYTAVPANEYTLRLIRESRNDGSWIMGEDIQ